MLKQTQINLIPRGLCNDLNWLANTDDQKNKKQITDHSESMPFTGITHSKAS